MVLVTILGTAEVDFTELKPSSVAVLGLKMHEQTSPPRYRRKRNAKCIKAQEGRYRYVLGHDIYMERVSALCSRALIGRL